MNWDILIKAFVAVVGAVGIISQVMHHLPRSRAALKHDLEVLKLIDSNDPNYLVVKKHVDNSVAKIYAAAEKRRSSLKVYSWSDFVLGTILLFLGIWWVLLATVDGFSWWVLLPAFIVIGGIGNISNAFDIESEKVKAKKGNEDETAT